MTPTISQRPEAYFLPQLMDLRDGLFHQLYTSLARKVLADGTNISLFPSAVASLAAEDAEEFVFADDGNAEFFCFFVLAGLGCHIVVHKIGGFA